MTLSLYEYGDETESYMKNMFHWFPVEEQWWITGFTGRTQKEYIYPVAIGMVLIGTVGFSERPDLYEGLKKRVSNTNVNDYDLKQHIIFDDVYQKVWINFYGKGVLK